MISLLKKSILYYYFKSDEDLIFDRYDERAILKFILKILKFIIIRFVDYFFFEKIISTLFFFLTKATLKILNKY